MTRLTTQQQDEHGRKRVRAKQACRTCNARRVKCNVAETQPCSNCQSTNSSCEVLPSRRGRYVRRQRQSSTQQENVTPSTIASTHDEPSIISHTNRAPTPQSHPSQHPRQASPTTLAQESDTLQTPSGESALFFGESNLLTCVAGGVIGPDSTNTPTTQQRGRHSNHSVVPLATTLVSPEHAESTSPKYRYLQSEGAFNFPAQDDCLAILHAYFLWFHPCFPILDRAETANLHAQCKIPPLLLQSLLFIGATYCDENIIQRIGFKDRREAKSILYNRARLLFEAEVELNKIVTLQAVFLLSFRRTGPSDTKDVRYWLSIAITLAQSYGLHRSTKFTRMDLRQLQMRRRIWYSIYVRDRQSSASLGLPSRIADEDCDIEDLYVSDLQADDIAEAGHPFGAVQPEHIVYVTKMVEIARLLGRIMNGLFAPKRKAFATEEKAGLRNSLEQWKNELPEDMRVCGMNGTETIWTFLLHLAHNHLYILIYRNVSGRSESGHDIEDDRIAIDAACRIARIVEDMLSRDMIQLGQMHSITTIFAALCVHTMDLRRSTGVRKRLAEHRAQICLIGLKEIQKYWKINNTVLDLFFQYLDDATAKRLHNEEAEPAITASEGQATGPDDGAPLPESMVSWTSDCPVTGQRDRRFDPTSQSNQDPVSMPPPMDLMDGFADYFSLFADTNMYMNNEADMRDLDMLQRCL